MAKVSLLGVPTDAQTFEIAIATLLKWAQPPGMRYVSTCPVYTIMMCVDDPAVMAAVSGAAMAAADGMPVVWMQRRRGHPEAERVYGPDVMLALCEHGVPAGLGHFLLGGAPGVPQRLAEKLHARFPGLNIAGAHSPPFSDQLDAPDPALVALLNDSGANVIWVGLGSPKQDLWMALYRPLLRAPLLIGVGAAFDMLAGVKRQAPAWMRGIGLEWLFRLAQEPGRLGKRYLVHNPRFVWRVVLEELALRGSRRS
jgi:N-acetylglucosaminyldiphosphoundecaprenol N-acetyl-beta-D-mannosaminyltransferase